MQLRGDAARVELVSPPATRAARSGSRSPRPRRLRLPVRTSCRSTWLAVSAALVDRRSPSGGAIRHLLAFRGDGTPVTAATRSRSVTQAQRQNKAPRRCRSAELRAAANARAASGELRSVDKAAAVMRNRPAGRWSALRSCSPIPLCTGEGCAAALRGAGHGARSASSRRLLLMLRRWRLNTFVVLRPSRPSTIFAGERVVQSNRDEQGRAALRWRFGGAGDWARRSSERRRWGPQTGSVYVRIVREFGRIADVERVAIRGTGSTGHRCGNLARAAGARRLAAAAAHECERSTPRPEGSGVASGTRRRGLSAELEQADTRRDTSRSGHYTTPPRLLLDDRPRIPALLPQTPGGTQRAALGRRHRSSGSPCAARARQ